MATISMNGMGEITFEEYGRKITDPSEITYIKRHSNWKSKVYELSMNLMKEIDSNIEEKRECFKYTPQLIETQEIQNKINNLSCKTYIITPYNSESFQSINNKAINDANRYADINAIKKPIWKKNKNKKDLAAKKLQEFIDFYKDKDSDLESKYYENENNIKRQKDADYLRDYTNTKNSYLRIITDNEKEINSMLSDTLHEVDKTFELNAISGNYNQSLNHSAIIAISLPSKNVIETRKGNMLASGKISVKTRSEKDISADWNLFCYGLILNITARVFNVNTCIENVLINTQFSEISKTTGNQITKDFSNCLFNRTSFEQINFNNIDPELTVKSFATTLGTVKQKNSPTKSRPAAPQKTKKRKYEIELSDEISNLSIDIIISCLKSLGSKYGSEIFIKENEKRLLGAIRDILPKNEAEQQLLRIIIENSLISEITSSNQTAESKFINIVEDNNITESDRFLSELKSMI